MPAPTLDFRNTNALWCSVLAETLGRCGVAQAVISPGSRSTPLTLALVRQPRIETIPVLDERSAAFFALGLAKQNQRPVVLVCTSGTAGANYFSAVIEAQESGVPLIVITADRPPEMRECASGQTIDQQKLFGAHVNWYHEFAVPEARIELLRYLRQTAQHACERAIAPHAGPIHLNAPFRDPLPPVEDETATALRDKIVDEFFEKLRPVERPAADAILIDVPKIERGLIVAGSTQPGDGAGYAAAVAQLARKTGWPVLADALSPLRMHEAAGQCVVCYDAIARNEELRARLKPDFVLSLGGWPISKALRGWVDELDVPTWLVSERAMNLDAVHGRTRRIACSVGALAEQWPDQPVGSAYSEQWLRCDLRVREKVENALATTDWLFEGKAAWLLSRNLPAETPVFAANSMPVRDLETFWMPGTRGQRIFFSRGANGIDGTLSTALGIAHGNRPSVLLTGDLALLHDTNGFLLRPKLRGSLTVVLINNRGGGIFQHLPVAQFDPPFEDYFATPQEVAFGKLCAAYGAEHVLVRDWEQFTSLVLALPEAGVRVLEIRTDRKRDAACRKKLFAELAVAAV